MTLLASLAPTPAMSSMSGVVSAAPRQLVTDLAAVCVIRTTSSHQRGEEISSLTESGAVGVMETSCPPTITTQVNVPCDDPSAASSAR